MVLFLAGLVLGALGTVAGIVGWVFWQWPNEASEWS
jgi:hypothetical protein